MIFSILFLLLAIALLTWAWVTALDNPYDEDDMKEFREWDATLMDGLEDEDEWDNNHHNEDV